LAVTVKWQFVTYLKLQAKKSNLCMIQSYDQLYASQHANPWAKSHFRIGL